MTEMPRDSSNYFAQVVPIDTVKPGYSLAVDRGEGRQLFQVEEVAFHSKRDEAGGQIETFTLTSGPVAGGGKPWVIEQPAGSTVTRLLPPSQRVLLQWTDDNNAYLDKVHYHLYKRPDGQWNLALFNMQSSEPGGFEDKLGNYVMTTFEDGKELAQALADQRRQIW
jgi:hypothetical protein